MNQEEYFKKLRAMPEAAKIALIVIMLNRLDDIINGKDAKIMRMITEALKESCNKIIDISYEISKDEKNE